MPQYTTLDLRTGIEVGSIDLQLYVRNLFDRRGQLFVNVANLAQVSVLQPRTIGVTAAVQF